LSSGIGMCSGIGWGRIGQEGMGWNGMEWDGDREGLEGVVWYGMVWCGMVWYGMVWCRPYGGYHLAERVGGGGVVGWDWWVCRHDEWFRWVGTGGGCGIGNVGGGWGWWGWDGVRGRVRRTVGWGESGCAKAFQWPRRSNGQGVCGNKEAHAQRRWSGHRRSLRGEGRAGMVGGGREAWGRA
jgi:hypothetical protein